MIVKRDRYLNRLISKKHNGMVKVITGVRRCGKSFLLFKLFTDHLRESGVDEDHIISIALDTDENEHLRKIQPLHDYINDRMRDQSQYYVLIDEIQLAKNFIPLLNSLLRKENIDVYVTGSNSKFLSTDVITEFRGRGDEVRIRPFSFAEFKEAHKGSLQDAIREYIDYGGLPELTKKSTPEEKTDYLRNLVESTYLLDIKERYDIRTPFALDNVLDVVSSTVGSMVNISKLKNTMISAGYRSVNEDTVRKYLGYLKDSFLFERCDRYDVRGRKYITTHFKMYSVDHGLNKARINFRQEMDIPHVMENIIYNELRTRGYIVDVGMVSMRKKNDDKTVNIQTEIDFIARKGNKQYYIQSAYRIDDEEKMDTELTPLLKIKDSFRKIVVTYDDVRPHYNDDGILFMGLIDFLIDEKNMDF